MTGFEGDVKIYPEIVWTNGQPEMDSGIGSAVYISLFTDKGWFADPSLGSNLHKLDDRLLTNQTRLDYIEGVKKALDWLLEDGVAESIEVSGEIQSPFLLAVLITITEPGKAAEVIRYTASWDATEAPYIARKEDM